MLTLSLVSTSLPFQARYWGPDPGVKGFIFAFIEIKRVWPGQNRGPV